MTWKITSRFGHQEAFRNHIHKGIDFALPNNTELRSIQDGVIEKIVNYGNANIGKGVFIKFNDGKTAIYGHLSKISNIKVGDKVSAGDLIGYSGNSGHCVGKNGGYHLHFGIKEGSGNFIDPTPYIDHIQNMDNPNLLAQMSNSIDPVQTSDNLFTIGNIFKEMSINSDLLQLFKANFITLLSEIKLQFILAISDYSIFSQYLKHIIQFFLG